MKARLLEIISKVADAVAVGISLLVSRWAIGLSTPQKDVQKAKRLLSAIRYYSWHGKRWLRWQAVALGGCIEVVCSEMLGVSYFRLLALRRRIRRGLYADDMSIGMARGGLHAAE